MKMHSLVVVLLSTAMLSACGWHLRGTLALPDGLDRVYLNSRSDSQVLRRSLEELLISNEVNIVESPTAAQLIIDILSYDEERRVVSIGDNTLVTEYELINEAVFSVIDSPGNVLLQPTEISVIRNYQFDQNNVLGKAEEERLIQTEMRREMAQQITRRLRFLDPQGEIVSPAATTP